MKKLVVIPLIAFLLFLLPISPLIPAAQAYTPYSQVCKGVGGAAINVDFNISPTSGTSATQYKVTINWDRQPDGSQEWYAWSEVKSNEDIRIVVFDTNDGKIPNGGVILDPFQTRGKSSNYTLQNLPSVTGSGNYGILLTRGDPNTGVWGNWAGNEAQNHCIISGIKNFKNQDAPGQAAPQPAPDSANHCIDGGKLAAGCVCDPKLPLVHGCFCIPDNQNRGQACGPGFICDKYFPTDGRNFCILATEKKATSCAKQNEACNDSNLKCCGDFLCQDGRCVDKQNTDPTLRPTLDQPPPPPCKSFDPKTGGCTSINSALGVLSTDPAGFIQSIFALLLSISGGVALLLIIRAGYKMMTSQGKPEALQQARDDLIAAIVGLLFLIFSFVILQVIGVDILKIPGFGGNAGGGSSTAGAGSTKAGEGGSCDLNGNNQCNAGLTCVSLGNGQRSGVCKRTTGASCDVNASKSECPVGQKCVSDGTGNGRSGKCQ